MPGGQNLTVTITSGTVLKTILILLGFFLLFYLRDLVLVILTAIVLASAIEPAIRFFSRYKVPRLPSVVIIYLLIAIFFFVLFYFFVPPLLDDAINLLGTIPGQLARLGLLNSSEFISSNLLDFSSIFSLQDSFFQFRDAVSGASGGVIKAAGLVFGSALSFILIIVLSFYFAVQETGVDDFLRIVTPVKHQDYIVDLWKRAQLKIGLWMQGQILLGVIVAVLVYLGLTILGLQYAFVLAVIAAVFELIPIFGPILAAIPAVAIAFGDGGLSLALMVVALYVIIQQFENHLIYPLVVRKVVGVPPLLVIIALIAGAKIAGFLGIILSVPFSAAAKEYIDDLQRSKARGGNDTVPIP